MHSVLMKGSRSKVPRSDFESIKGAKDVNDVMGGTQKSKSEANLLLL